MIESEKKKIREAIITLINVCDDNISNCEECPLFSVHDEICAVLNEDNNSLRDIKLKEENDVWRAVE